MNNYGLVMSNVCLPDTGEMMGQGRPLKVLRLSDAEREELSRWTRRARTGQALALRARIVLDCASGKTNTEVAAARGVTKQMVGKWRARFLERRAEGLLDEPRPGKPRSLDDERIEQLIATTLNAQPRGATHWSTRGLAKQVAVSQSTVSRVWRAFGLQPHRSETFKLSTDPFFVEKVRDIVGLYLNPPERRWCCAWMRRARSRRWIARSRCCRYGPGLPERRTHDYARHGTTSLVRCAGHCHGPSDWPVHRRHRHQEFLRFSNHRRLRTAISRRAPGDGQLRHPQDAGGARVVCPSSAFPCPLHAHLRELAQSSRTLVRAANPETDQARHPSKHPRFGAGNSTIPRHAQR